MGNNFIDGFAIGVLVVGAIFFVFFCFAWTQINNTHNLRIKEMYLKLGKDFIRSSAWYGVGREKVGNALFLYGLYLRQGRSFDDTHLREKIDELGDNVFQRNNEAVKQYMDYKELK